MLKLSGQAADATMLGAAATPAGIILTVLSEGFGAVQDYSRGMSLGRTAAIHGAGAAVGIAASIGGAEFGFAVGEALFPAGGGIVGTVIGGVIGAYGGDKAGQFAGAAGASAAGFCRLAPLVFGIINNANLRLGNINYYISILWIQIVSRNIG
jgi:hypothetical protein